MRPGAMCLVLALEHCQKPKKFKLSGKILQKKEVEVRKHGWERRTRFVPRRKSNLISMLEQLCQERIPWERGLVGRETKFFDCAILRLKTQSANKLDQYTSGCSFSSQFIILFIDIAQKSVWYKDESESYAGDLHAFSVVSFQCDYLSGHRPQKDKFSKVSIVGADIFKYTVFQEGNHRDDKNTLSKTALPRRDDV